MAENRRSETLGGTDNGPEKRSSFEELLEHTEDRDKPFTRMLEKAQDPIATIDLWSDYRKDIVRVHTEGFQRLSATLAYVDALKAGEDAGTDYIAVQDASSNIYQHISLLLRDREMAKLVNVLESESPEDVYLKVADTIPTVEITRLKKDRDRMKEDNCEDYEAKMAVVEVLTEKLASNSSDENRGPTSEETKAAREASKELLSLIATRKHSKSPVMTKGTARSYERSRTCCSLTMGSQGASVTPGERGLSASSMDKQEGRKGGRVHPGFRRNSQ